MKTAEDLAIAALAECAEFGQNFPAARSVLFSRASLRQAQLFERASRLNPDYLGTCIVGLLNGGRLNLADLLAGTVPGVGGDPAPPAAAWIERIEIADPGASTYEPGARVHPIPLSEVEEPAAYPPRVTIRSGVLRQVGTDLSGVVSLEVYYPRRPAELARKEDPVEIVEPYHGLLVFDLARMMVARAVALDKDVREHAAAYLAGREEELLAAFDAHVTGFSPVYRAFA